MGAGIKQPVNIFKLRNLAEPREVFNWRLWFAVLTFGLMGASRGVDEGLITGAFNTKNFQQTIHFKSYSAAEQTNIKGNVSAMVQIGCVGGALFAFYLCDRVGRLWATRQLCIVWAVGIAIFMANNGSLAAVYAGRFIAGLGVGQTAVVAPIYLSEIAPAPIRGLCTCFFTAFVYLGIVLAYFANYGCSKNIPGTKAQWEVPTSLHVMLAALIFTLSFFQYESPRWLITKGRYEEASKNLARLRHLPEDHPYLINELSGIDRAWQDEQESTMGQGAWGICKEIFAVPSNLYRLYLGLMAQILAQWTGAGSITLYAADLFGLLGLKGQNESLLVTGVFGIVKLTAGVCCALFLVDVIGRKRSLLIGITLQAVSVLYLAAFLTANPRLGEKGFEIPSSRKGSSIGAIAMIYISGVGWALGWNSIQYILTAELFPLRIRAVCSSIIMCIHFAAQYGNSRAVPNMLVAVSKGGIAPMGTFWFFFAVTALGGLWVWFSIPETAGRSLESMDRLFTLPWYKIGLHGNEDAEVLDEVVKEKESVEHYESVEKVPAARTQVV